MYSLQFINLIRHNYFPQLKLSWRLCDEWFLITSPIWGHRTPGMTTYEYWGQYIHQRTNWKCNVYTIPWPVQCFQNPLASTMFPKSHGHCNVSKILWSVPCFQNPLASAMFPQSPGQWNVFTIPWPVQCFQNPLTSAMFPQSPGQYNVPAILQSLCMSVNLSLASLHKTMYY